MVYLKHFIIILTIGLVCFGQLYASPIKDSMTKTIESTVGNKFAPAEKWECDINGNMLDWVQGKIPKLKLVGTNVKYDKMSLRKIDIFMTKIKFDLLKKRLKSCETATFTAEITDKEMTSLIKENISAIEKPIISSKNGLIQIQGQYKINKIKINFALTSSLSVRNGKNFVLDIENMTVTNYNVKIPKWIQNKIVNSINPVYTFPENKIGLFVNSITPVNGYFSLSGSLDPEKVSKF